MPILEEMTQQYGAEYRMTGAFMHHNGHEVDLENHYLAGRFFKEGTPVPEGYNYMILPLSKPHMQFIK